MNGKWIKQEHVTGLVSVIIPTYDRRVYLEQAILSVAAQTYRPIECIVVDDGSTDDTEKMVNDLIKKNDKGFVLRYIQQQNSGSQVARNTGTAASTGEFIQYLDSDDLLYPEKIQQQVFFLQEHEGCDGVWADWTKGTVEKNELVRSVAREDLLTQLLTEHCIVNFSFLMRRKLVQKIGEWDINIKRNQEIDFQVRGLLAGADFQYQANVGGLWRIHDGERIANTSGTKEIFNFYNKWETILIKKGLFNEQMKINISNIYFWLANRGTTNKRERLALLSEAVRLNPKIALVRSSKMRFLQKIFGMNVSLRLWNLRSKKN